MREIPLGRSGYVALVDDEDYGLVSQHKWQLLRGGGSGKKLYAQGTIKIDGSWRVVRMHRFIMGLDSPYFDHRDGNGLNNQRANLRTCTPTQNQHNRGPNPGRRFKGVYWDKKLGKWTARITNNYRLEYLGLFDTEEDAARAYDRRAVELHGEFARPNLPT